MEGNERVVQQTDIRSANRVDAARLRSRIQRKTLLKQFGRASVFVAPNFILVMLFTFIPAVGGLALSTAEWDVFSELKFVGLENYVGLIDDDDFWIALRNNVVYTVTTVPVSVILSLVLACWPAIPGSGYSMPTMARSTTFCGRSVFKDPAGSTIRAGRSWRW